jgi:hypothetical protein
MDPKHCDRTNDRLQCRLSHAKEGYLQENDSCTLSRRHVFVGAARLDGYQSPRMRTARLSAN